MNHFVKNKQPLLDKFGKLNEPGYAYSEIFEYNPEMISASKWRIKEWDYYAILSKDYSLSFTVADLGYLGIIKVSFFDLKLGKEYTKEKKVFFPFGKLNLPKSIETGDVVFKKKGFNIQFLNHKDERRLIVEVNNLYKRKNLRADLRIKKVRTDHMTIATPWEENQKAFYYNQKINCMPVSGDVYLDGEEYVFNPKKDFAVLDWGRGVWTYKNTWFWSNASGIVNGKHFGFNFGYGFGDTSKATENMLFYDGKAHKLEDVKFEYNQYDFLDTWTFTSKDKRVKLKMTPIYDRRDKTNLIFIKNLGHQVFGKFNGTVVLDDENKLEVKDLLGFAEVITNHY
ncbi:MAG: DUF2804 domain-containing protein [Candidatus Izimaplasma sp.]|nr:DUF2804 domain-containing protein [Candidatus Izimaplasma bacterium]